MKLSRIFHYPDDVSIEKIPKEKLLKKIKNKYNGRIICSEGYEGWFADTFEPVYLLGYSKKKNDYLSLSDCLEIVDESYDYFGDIVRFYCKVNQEKLEKLIEESDYIDDGNKIYILK